MNIYEDYKTKTRTRYFAKIVIFITIIGMISLSYYSSIYARKEYTKRKNDFEKSFTEYFDQKVNDLYEKDFIKDYNVSNISYVINDITFYSNKDVINVTLQVDCDERTYKDNEYLMELSVGNELYNVFDNYNRKITNKSFEIVGEAKVNDRSIKVVGLDKTYTPDLYTYVDEGKNYSKEIFIIGACIILICCIILLVTKKGVRNLYIENQDKLTEFVPKLKKKRIIATVFICLIVLILGLGPIGYGFYEKNSEYKRAKELMASGDYQGAYNKFESIDNINDADVLKKATKNILDGDYDAAIDLLKSMQGYDSLIESITNNKNETYYKKANECVENKDYINARNYYNQILDYKDSSEKLSEIDDLASYYDAIECEKTSIVEALKIYKTLPEDLLDVKDKIAKWEVYNSCVNEYGDIGGYVVTGISINDFYVDGDQIKMKSDAWAYIDVKESTDSSYDFYGKWDNREIYISPTKVKITEGGKSNILKTDGTVEEGIQRTTKKNTQDNNSNGTCPNCGGTGVVKFYYGASDWEAYMDGVDPYELGECPMCHGTGKAD